MKEQLYICPHLEECKDRETRCVHNVPHKYDELLCKYYCDYINKSVCGCIPCSEETVTPNFKRLIRKLDI